jgi:hypothetical protein
MVRNNNIGMKIRNEILKFLDSQKLFHQLFHTLWLQDDSDVWN